MTRQKQAVLQALSASGRSLHPSEIQALAQRAAPTLNLSTVYRQLKTLVDEQRVKKVELPGQPARFEAATLAPTPSGRSHHHAHGPGDAAAHPVAARLDHHHHFHCLDCEQVFPIHGCPGPMEGLAPQGFQVVSHDLTLHGRCADCAMPKPPRTRASRSP